MIENFAIVIHGGAEDKSRAEIGPEKEAGYRKGLADALEAGWNILNNGGSAVEAVEAAVRSMEDNPLFNAARGGALTIEGEHQFDAAIMDGKTLQAGSVAGVKSVKYPISLARAIMERSEHVILSGEGAKAFAKKEKLELVQNDSYFTTAEKVEELEKEKEQKLEEVTKDTVGAVALDKQGNLAAATSTGGLTGQHKGRIGDSPLIGCGTYANNEVCAVSCTGDGESITRAVIAHEVYALMKYKELPIAEAARQAREMYHDKIEKDRNLVAIDPQGNIALEYETQLMFRGYRQNNQEPFVAIWED
ncbi:isoaspartyl peptidase/L-asparaginase [Adhaeribacter aerolatus]|uniref:Isoaspartyl peptidase n=1 Tax=Adhaeribacter aerolatus TaxID=670289 RepID=A0A512AUR3_9BACT|nr:isoaspartyl peptidase/L-asparaginase [Adhaeribacter aerolatus]GEO03423.1 isoaspartyl peptidase/L-asparaginase [Adhaeribacter aerolatus]